MTECNIEIIRRGVEHKSLWLLWVTFTYDGINGGLHFTFHLKIRNIIVIIGWLQNV